MAVVEIAAQRSDISKSCGSQGSGRNRSVAPRRTRACDSTVGGVARERGMGLANNSLRGGQSTHDHDHSASHDFSPGCRSAWCSATRGGQPSTWQDRGPPARVFAAITIMHSSASQRYPPQATATTTESAKGVLAPPRWSRSTWDTSQPRVVGGYCRREICLGCDYASARGIRPHSCQRH